MKTQRTLAAAILIALGLVVPAKAGIVLIPGELKDADLVLPGPQNETTRQALPMPFSYHTSLARHDVTVENGVARITSNETLKMSGEAKSLVGLIPLSVSAELSSVVVKIDGKRVDAEVLPADKATDRLQAFAKTLKSVAVLSLTDRPLVIVSAIEVNRSTEVAVEFKQPVSQSQGVNFLNVPMSAVRWTGRSLDRLSVGVTINSKAPVRAILSPTHPTSIDRPQHNIASVKVRQTNVIDEADFRLCWVEDEDPLGLRLLTHADEDEANGYFLLLGNPTGNADDKAIEKDLTFVLDTSGSMRGEKLEQCRAAIEYCLENLNEGDRFNVVTFGSKIESFRESVVASSKENLAAAQLFVEDLVANGRTNINGALEQAGSSQKKSSRPQIAIFLTDGTPTAGELVDEKILANFTKANEAGLRVFVLGVGNEVNAHLLDQLAEDTDGLSEYVSPDEEIDQKIAALYNQLANPVMNDVEVAFGELQTQDVFPRKIPALFRNSQVMLFGRYRDAAEGTVEVTGMLSDRKMKYSTEVETPTDVSCEFIAPLWAARKIGYLLQEVRLHGDEQELITEVIRLSKKYGIVTEYTQQLAMAPGAFSRSALAGFAGGGGFRDGAALQADAFRQIETARAMKTGVWAVSQARNDKFLQSQVLNTNAANNFLDRRGQKVQAAKSLQKVGDRAYYFRNGVWEDGADAGKRKTRRVKAFSDEYFKLLQNKDFARAQQLGGSISLNIGNERVIVEQVPGAKPPVPQQQNQQLPQLQQQRRLNQIRDQQKLNINPGQFRNFAPIQQQAIPQIQNQVSPEENEQQQIPKTRD